MAADFVHLHVHSDYSLLDGCAAPRALVGRAAEAGMRALALTDHGVLHGAVQFAVAAQECGIKPIIGCELYVARNSRRDRSEADGRGIFHLTVLAENQEGYRNLCRLSSKGFLEGYYYRPRVDKELLREHSEGLIVLSGCLAGEIPSLLLAGDFEAARAACEWYLETFGRDRFFLELIDHGLADQKAVNRGLLELHRRLGIPIVATNDAHYLARTDAAVQDALLCIQTGKQLDDPGRLRMETDQLYLKDPAEMERTFHDVPEALANTVAIAERCDVRLLSESVRLPEFRAEWGAPEQGGTALLRQLATSGAESIYGRPLPGAAKERLEHELAVIEKTGFADYFLIVWDLVRFAKSRGIAVGPGRGSSASSIVAYSLGITAVDPLAHGLMFERFLNPERVTMPDIDIDFCFERRAEVIEYAVRRFGEDRVAQIGTFGTLAARAAVRDVGRALGLAYGEVDKVAKAIPAGLALAEAVERSPELKAEVERDERLRRLIDVSLKVEGKPRHLSVHAAGIVIAPGPLVDHVPLCTTSEGAVVTQFSGEDLERLRFLKMDLLGLRTLTVLDKARRLVEEHRGEVLDLGAVSLDDPKVYELLQRGEASGVFQLETQMFHGLLREVRPQSFRDLVAILALGRPGPMTHLDEFLRRRRGEVAVAYPHPAMADILEETYGIMLYQEQVMQVAMRLAGFTPGEADLLRRAMGKKMPEIMAAEGGRFVSAAMRRGVDQAVAEAVFDDIAKFAEYGFPKSHSVAYALVAYWCAYLKAHYPVEFMAARLSSAMSDSGQVSRYIAECRRIGIRLDGPDVNQSGVEFTARGGAIRFGLAGIKNVGEMLARAIVETRAGRPYASIEEFCDRLAHAHMSRKALESLIRAGAFDRLIAREEALARLDQLARRGAHFRSSAGQEALFSEAPAPPAATAAVPLAERLADEFELLGAYVSAHPLDPYREVLGDYCIPESGDGNAAVVGGVVVELRETTSRSGRDMAFALVEDIHGKRCELVLFPQAYQRGALAPGSVVVAKGRLEIDEGGAKVVANSMRKVAGPPVVLVVKDLDELDRVRTLVAGKRGGRPVVLEIRGRRSSARLALPPKHWIEEDPRAVEEIESAGIPVLAP